MNVHLINNAGSNGRKSPLTFSFMYKNGDSCHSKKIVLNGRSIYPFNNGVTNSWGDVPPPFHTFKIRTSTNDKADTLQVARLAFLVYH